MQQNEELQSSFSNVNLEDFSKFINLKINLNQSLSKFRVSYSKDFVSFQFLYYQNYIKA